MATIPRFSSQIAPATGAPSPFARGSRGGFRAEAATFGELAKLGQAGLQATIAIQQVADYEAKRDQRSTVQNRLNKMAAMDRSKMAELLGRKGENAKTVLADWTKYVEEDEVEVSNDTTWSPYQRDLYKEASRASRGSKFDRSLEHQRRQGFDTDIRTMRANEDNLLLSAVDSRNDKGITVNGQEQHKYREEYASRNLSAEIRWGKLGYSREQRDRERKIMDTQFYTAMARGFISDMRADGFVSVEATNKTKNFINDAFSRGQLTSPARDQLLREWRVGANQQLAHGAIQVILADKDLKTQGDKFKKADEIANEQVRALVKNRLTDIKKAEDRADKDFYDGTYSNALLRIQSATTAEEARDIVNGYRRGPGPRYTGGGTHVKQLEAYSKTRFGDPNDKVTTRGYAAESEAEKLYDNGTLKTDTEIAAYLAGKTSDTGINSVLSYKKSGGRMGPLGPVQFTVTAKKLGYGGLILSRVPGGRRGQMEVDPEKVGELTAYLQTVFADTEGQITEKDIERELSEWVSVGFVKDPIFNTFKVDMTLAEAVRKGRVDDWFPPVTKIDKIRVTSILEALSADMESRGEGKIHITDDAIALYVKRWEYGIKPKQPNKGAVSK